MRCTMWWAVMAALLLFCQTGHGATERTRNELPIPQLKNAPLQQARPDIVVRSLSVRNKGRCEPGRAVVTFDVVVANVGNAASSMTAGSPLVIRVIDKHNELWGGKTELKEPIPPGGSLTVAVAVPFFQNDPAHMAVRTTHPFTAIVAREGQMDQLRRDINVPPAVGVSLWENCSGRNP